MRKRSGENRSAFLFGGLMRLRRNNRSPSTRQTVHSAGGGRGGGGPVGRLPVSLANKSSSFFCQAARSLYKIIFTALLRCAGSPALPQGGPGGPTEDYHFIRVPAAAGGCGEGMWGRNRTRSVQSRRIQRVTSNNCPACRKVTPPVRFAHHLPCKQGRHGTGDAAGSELSN